MATPSESMTPVLLFTTLAHMQRAFPPQQHDDLWKAIWSVVPRKERGPGVCTPDSFDVTSAEIFENVKKALTGYDQASSWFRREVAVRSIISEELEQAIRHAGSDLSDKVAAHDAADLALAVFAVEADPFPPRVRKITGGPEKETFSVKFRNLFLDLGAATELVGHGTLFGLHAGAHPNPFLLAASILFLLFCARRTAKVRLSDVEASVFWGFVKARNSKDNTATEGAISAQTNAERIKHDRRPLSSTEVLEGLEYLERLGSITKEKGQKGVWKIAEKWELQ